MILALMGDAKWPTGGMGAHGAHSRIRDGAPGAKYITSAPPPPPTPSPLPPPLDCAAVYWLMWYDILLQITRRTTVEYIVHVIITLAEAYLITYNNIIIIQI